MGASTIFFLLWAFLSTLGGGADPLALCLQDDDFDLAIQECTRILEQPGHTPDNVTSAFLSRGFAHSYRSDIDRANADFDRAIAGIDVKIQSNSLSADAFFMRARARMGRKHFPEAIADYGEAIRLDPQGLEAINMRCWARALWGAEFDLARADCDTAIKLSNSRADYLDSRGLLGLKQGKFAEAWADYDAAQAKVDPNSFYFRSDTAHYLYGRGIAALRMGRTAEGNADLQEALRLKANIGGMFASYGIAP
ncbi:MAG: hypothetical protein H7X89_03700 [Rhizobiales bacterium]|nr:hypothetical protein [Hyphomicrobiales bacterium]